MKEGEKRGSGPALSWREKGMFIGLFVSATILANLEKEFGAGCCIPLLVPAILFILAFPTKKKS